MKGILIVNGFLKTESFAETYKFLLDAAKKHGIELELKTNSDFLFPVENTLPLFGADFVLFWDKDIFLAKRLEEVGIPVFNSAAAIEKSDSKILTALELSKNKIPAPATFISPKTYENTGYGGAGLENLIKEAGETLGFPMIIKEEFGSFGKQVYLADNPESAKKTVRDLGYKGFIIQEFISESRGRDLRINVVGSSAVTAVIRQNPNDFRSNIENGGFAKKTEITKEQEKLAVAAARALGLDFAGVDILFSENGTDLVCEVNSNPHFKGAFNCTGINLGDGIIEYILKKLR